MDHALILLRQAIAALLHLHSLGILHRDLRAANILIAGLDPLHGLVADLGVSHLLSAFAGACGASGGSGGRGSSKVTSVLTGAASLGPLQVGAPPRYQSPPPSPPPPPPAVGPAHPAHSQWLHPAVFCAPSRVLCG